MEIGSVVVTGAGRGLGRVLVERYLAGGSDVWAGCRKPTEAADLADAGAQVRQLDVGEEGSITRFAAEVADRGEVAVLINNAGTDARAFGSPPDQRGPFDINVEHFLAEMRVNAAGPMLLTRALRQPLIAGRPGKVVNISSRLASMVTGAELCWDIGYNASKAALNSITVRTAHLLADTGVIVVAIHPGSVRTEMGGPQAELAPAQAADTLVRTIASLRTEHSGAFLNYDGKSHPW